MDFRKLNSNDMLYVLIIAVLSFLIIKKKNYYVFMYAIGLYLISKSFNKNNYISLTTSLVISYFLATFIFQKKDIKEGMAGKKKKKIEYEEDVVEEEDDSDVVGEEDDSSDADSSDADSSDDDDFDEHDHEDDVDDNFIDMKSSFLETYKKLSPKQIKGLNKDTKNLMSTQKKLIETLNNMGPTLKQGKDILDTFKEYFGKDKDLNKKGLSLKDLKKFKI